MINVLIDHGPDIDIVVWPPEISADDSQVGKCVVNARDETKDRKKRETGFHGSMELRRFRRRQKPPKQAG